MFVEILYPQQIDMKSVISLRPKTIKQKKESVISNIPNSTPSDQSNIETPVKSSEISDSIKRNGAINLTISERKSLKSNQQQPQLIKSLRKIKSISQLQPYHKQKIFLTTSKNRANSNKGLPSPIKPSQTQIKNANDKVPINVLAIKERFLQSSSKKQRAGIHRQQFPIGRTIKRSIMNYPPA